VGLVASLLFSQYQVPHVIIEQLPTPDNHPQAHFLNCRSMEILRELNMLNQAVYARSAPSEEWRRFVYCTGLANLPTVDDIPPASTDSILGVVDHFADAQHLEISPERVTHFPQHDFVRLLRSAALKSNFCHAVEGHRASIQEYPDRVAVTLTDSRTGRRQQIRARYVVAADGAHSFTRKQLKIKSINNTGILQHLMNVHFYSSQLAERLRSRTPAMLYFVYNSAGIAVLVAHAFNRGEFVAQIPYFPPYQQTDDFDQNTCIKLLQKLAGQSIDVDVRSIRKWRMGIGLASRFQSRQGRCFLIGDAAHQFTPAGGFGMNTGIQDAHNLIWKLAQVLQSDDSMPLQSAKKLLSSYEQERKPIARANAKLSLQNYLLTLRIPRAIGLNIVTVNGLIRFISHWPDLFMLKRLLFRGAMRLGLKQIEWLKFNSPITRRRQRAIHKIFSDAKRQTLQLLFPGQDLGFTYTNGWLFGQSMNETESLDPLVFKPLLVIGGRMPHFWLIDVRGRRISTLDLPRRMMKAEALPCYVLLKAGNLKTDINEFKGFNKQSIVDVYVSRKQGNDKHHFSYYLDRPAFLPNAYAVLMRPDGHIAWFKTNASNDHGPADDFRATSER
jgi:2-polyprenyl-6-methoxyphenol hydroxylase-like FAD-dependent oxidoreductase